MGNVVNFEFFKGEKELDERFGKFLAHVEKFFGAKANPEDMIARLFFAMRYMSGVCRSFKIFALLGLSTHDQKQCKKYIIGMLEEMLEDLKNENY